MQILYQTKRQFSVGGSKFLADACLWSKLSLNTNQSKVSDIQKSIMRVGHSAVRIRNSIYLFGGVSDQIDTEIFTSLNILTNQWHDLSQGSPQNRDSHGFTVFMNQMYIFGGSNGVKQFDDFYIFNTYTNTFIKAQNKYIKGRNPMIFEAINDQYIVLIGGVNVESQQIFRDGYIFQNNEWKQYKLQGYPENIHNAKVAVCGIKMYLFGGQIIHQYSLEFLNDLYEIQVLKEQEVIKFTLIQTSQFCRPVGRINHALVALNKYYFICFGGEYINSKGKLSTLGDLWLFDCQRLKWSIINPKNLPLKPEHSFTMTKFNNIFYIIGGINDINQIKNQIYKIEFCSEILVSSQICANCKKISKQKKINEQQLPTNLIISVGYLYSLALQIKFPFHAISLLYNCSQIMQATYFILNIKKNINNLNYIEIYFNGNNLSRKQFITLLHHSDRNDYMSKIMLNLKLGGFRLGKTILFITADSNTKKVFLISADSKILPVFSSQYNYYAYIENINSEQVQTQEGNHHRNFIINFIKMQISQPLQVLNVKNQNRIYIFSNNAVMTAQKNYYYELISQGSEQDVQIYKNAKKIAFLEELGYPILKDPQLSLKTFLSLIYHNKQNLKIEIYLNNSKQPITLIDYAKNLEKMQQQKLIQRIQPVFDKSINVIGHLYRSLTLNLLENNYGLLLYYRGTLINRYSPTFGHLFQEKFYKKKFKKAKTLFPILGILNIIDGIELTYNKVDFKKNQMYKTFKEQIYKIIHKEQQLSQKQQQNQGHKKIKVK